jgi:uncharacterized delta-60 repeat protein
MSINKIVRFSMLFIILFTTLQVYSQPGQIDSSFARNGVFSSNIYDGCFFRTLIQPDNKIIGMSFKNYVEVPSVMVRLNPDGTIDSTFGSNGWAPPFCWGNSWDMTLQPDGKILAVGDGTDTMALVYRRNADGSRDTTFGLNGGVYIRVDGSNINLTCVRVQQDGKILLAGWAPASGNKILLIRLLSDGTFDNTFGDNGTGIKIYPLNGWSTKMLFQPGGKIIIGAIQNYKALLLRIKQDGSVDSAFGINGYTLAPFEFQVVPYWNNTLLCQKDGKILYTGLGQTGVPNGRIARFAANGIIDSTFGNYGVSSIDSFPINSAVCQWDDKILCSISQSFSIGSTSQLVRLNSDGTIDTSFGNHGFTASFTETNIYLYSVAVQHQGKIVMGGEQRKPSSIQGKPYDAYYTMLRYFSGLDCPQPIASFSYSVHNDTTVSFQDHSSSATQWYWDFGDGYSSEDRNPVHTFKKFGKYTVCLNIVDSCGNDAHCDSIYLKPNGIDDKLVHSILVYPNPFSTEFVVDVTPNTEKMGITVFRIDGKEILNQKLNSTSTRFDFTSIPAGVYIVKITGEKDSQVRKIIKE